MSGANCWNSTRLYAAVVLFGASLAGVAQAATSAAALAHSIREAGLDPEACYRVRDLAYSKEDIKLWFNEGYLIFSRPVEERRFAAVFFGEVDGGDGELLLLPPTRSERQSLAKFTRSPNLDEHFRNALLVFTDDSANELLERIRSENGGRPAPEMGPVLAEQWNSTLANVGEGFSPRLVRDLLNSPRAEHGFFLAALAGKQLGNFDVVYDPLAAEQVMVAQLTERNSKPVYDFWTSFPARSYRTRPPERVDLYGFAVDHYQIDANVDDALGLKAVTRATVQVGAAPQRVFAFQVSRAMRVSSVAVDGAAAELFARESLRGQALHPGEDDTVLIVTPEALPAGSSHEFRFEHQGNVITSPGKGVYYVGARSNWYPGGGEGYATFDLRFTYPRRLTLVTPGDIVEDTAEGDRRTTRRRTPRIHVAGFNLGEYERYVGAASAESPFTVEVFGNRNLEPALQPRPAPQPVIIDPRVPGTRAPRSPNITTILQTPPPPDPLARLHVVADDVAAALQFYAGLFGPPPLKNLTVSPIPDTFGQGFPGLIYLSTLAYLDPAERPASARGVREQVFFSDLIQAHEVAHQWWGSLVAPESYEDDWIVEGLAHYSSLLWLEKKKGAKAVQDVLDTFRDDLMRQGPDGATAESAGPMTWGYRLESSSASDAWRAITYEKSAWVLHMLRQRMGDAQFLKMLAELRKRYEFRSVSTREFQALVKEFLPPRMRSDYLDSFFDNWVYSTGVPAFKLKTSTRAVAGKQGASGIRLTGTLEQSGVDDDFSVDVPVEIYFAKGAPQVLWVRSSSEPASFSAALKDAPVRVVIGSVLAARK
jgi:hypothetical protein